MSKQLLITESSVSSVEKAVRYNQGKIRFDLVPSEVIEAYAAIATYGAGKYSDRNWENGLSWGSCFASAMRHLWAWWRGQDNDPESGLSHLAHALWNIGAIITYACRNTGTDDRQKVETKENEERRFRIYGDFQRGIEAYKARNSEIHDRAISQGPSKAEQTVQGYETRPRVKP